jgi:hypothetical protein
MLFSRRLVECGVVEEIGVGRGTGLMEVVHDGRWFGC